MAKPIVAKGFGPRWLRTTLAVCASIYWVGLWFESAGAPMHKVFPRPLLYFMQVASLFPKAADNIIEYRAEAWYCSEHTFREVDVRPFFPLRANDKENRFDRTMHFYRPHPDREGHVDPDSAEVKVMQALEDYIMTSQNARGALIGSVRLLSLRLPIPSAAERYERKRLEDVPPEQRKYWYPTKETFHKNRCKELRGQKGP